MVKINLPTIIIASIIAIIFIAIVVTQIINKKKGKSSCSCGGSCGSCGASSFCHPKKDDEQNEKEKNKTHINC